MALGMQNAGPASDRKDFVKYDARWGKLYLADRQQNPSTGSWETIQTDITKTAQFVMDLANIEVGFINYTEKGPVRVMVPLGAPFPPRPEGVDSLGKPAFKQGFNVLLAMPKDLGGGIREFNSNAAIVVDAMDALHDQYMAAPQAKEGKLPVVHIAATIPIKGGMSTNHQPKFEIVAWVGRPPALMPEGLRGNGTTSAFESDPFQRAAAPPTTGSTQVKPPPPPPPPPPLPAAPPPLAADDFG